MAETHNVYCKLSGLATEAGNHWDSGTIEPYMDEIVETFGPKRVMRGSDWPVVNLASDYASWRELSMNLLQRLEVSARNAILGGNASEFYRLGARASP